MRTSDLVRTINDYPITRSSETSLPYVASSVATKHDLIIGDMCLFSYNSSLGMAPRINSEGNIFYLRWLYASHSNEHVTRSYLGTYCCDVFVHELDIVTDKVFICKRALFAVSDNTINVTDHHYSEFSTPGFISVLVCEMSVKAANNTYNLARRI